MIISAKLHLFRRKVTKMNKAIITGRLTREPDIRYTHDNKAVAKYTLAVDRRYKRDGEQTADFINCVAFDRNAEFAEKYLHKGTKIAVCGRIQTGSYTNRDGVRVYTTDVVVEEHDFRESRNAAGSGNSNAGRNENTGYDDGFMNIPDGVDDEGLPFN